MKTKIFLTLFLILTLAFTTNTYASSHKKVGTTTASFLKMGIDAKVTALGGAYGAEYGGSSSILYNPAGIDLEEDIGQLNLMYNNSIVDTHYGFISYLNSKNKDLSFGVSLLYSTVRGIKETTLTDPQGKKGRSIDANDLAIILSGARPLANPNISIGANLTLIRCTLDNSSPLGLACDLGAIVTLNPNISLGLSIQNIGAGLRFNKEKDSLPLNLKIGSSFSLLNHNLLLLLDLNKPIDNKLYFNTGIEINYFKNISVRAGYTTSPSKVGSGLSLGAGISIRDKYTLNLSYTPYEELGDMIKMGLGVEY